MTHLRLVALAQLSVTLNADTVFSLLPGLLRGDPTAIATASGLDLDVAFRNELFRAPLPPKVDPWFLLHHRAE
jgi:hypothetical protein